MNTPHSGEIAAFELAKLVEYQPGSVVSRSVVKNKGGNVSVFAFDGGQELSEHTAPFDALVMILDGTAQVAVQGLPVELRAGQSVILPANKPHAVKAVTRFKMMLTMIKG